MAIEFHIKGMKFQVRSDHNATKAEEIEASNRILDLLAAGYVSQDNPLPGRGKERFRELRRYGELRETTIVEEVGLPKLDAPRIFQNADGTVWVWLADWECLDRRRLLFALHRVEGRLMYLPLRHTGELLALLHDWHLRLIMGWSQSFIEKHARELRSFNRDPAHEHGKDFVVETIPFFLRIGDRRYPFMARHLAVFNPVTDIHSLASRIVA